MSDPVTNVEIEDVLSSIRRLVSEDARPQSMRDTAKTAAMPVPEPEAAEPGPIILKEVPSTPADALILTPALRVAEDPSQASEAEAEHSEALQSAELDADQTEDDTAEETQAEDIQANATQANATRAEPLETVQSDETDTADEQAHHAGQHDAEVISEDAQSLPGDEIDLAEDIGETQNHDAPETSLSDDVEDVSEPLASYFEQTLVLGAQDAVEEQAQTEQQVDAADGAPEQAFAESSMSSNESIEDKISALESLIARTGQEFEPDGGEVEVTQDAPAMPWQLDTPPNFEDFQDPAEASQSGDFVSDPNRFTEAHASAAAQVVEEIAQQAEETLGDFEAAMPILDEESLRDMVADIVRQELQGPLGERITRNVRKLVRREIYRALATNELD